ncbi:hypothetical protein [Rhodobacter maris]|uniref:Uncharacterized protein n=1 Tax=Rhodobacter maris TaxID=446682 RepID=A0A285RK06_9RHOB|nr:hypothetical protein [Rhodobacter maris]SOB94476.1 hypothetical protein SAMN05877831_101469 [Rhodobacter maris]
MLALFIALIFSVGLVLLAEWRAEPRAAAPKAAPAPDLPRITGFSPGDVIELAIDGPLPRPEDLVIEQIGTDAQVSLDGTPTLIIEATQVQSLAVGAIRFRPA